MVSINKYNNYNIFTAKNFCFLLALSCGELYQQIAVVRLNLSILCRAVSDNSTAPIAPVYDNKSAARIRKGLHGAENTCAGVCSVTRIYINVQ